MEIIKNNYPAHKTISLIDEKTTANTVVDRPPFDTVQRAEVPPLPKTLVDNEPILGNTYPSHKTIVLAAETVENVKDVLKKELVEPAKDLLKKEEEIKKLLSTEIVNPVKDELKKELESVKNIISPVPEIKVDSTLLSPINQGVVIDAVQKNVSQTLSKENYPAHKTVSLASIIVAEQKAEAKTPEQPIAKPNAADEVKPPVLKPIESIITTTESNSTNAYPAHKTFSFVTTDNKIADNQIVAPTVQTTAKAEVKPQPVTQPAKNEANTAPVKAKKPLVWIIASATILVTSAAAIWYANHEKNKLEEEVVALKQSNVELSESLLKLQKDIRIDDIIARAGTLDAKNNIAVEQDATKADVIRTCFSLMPSTNAKQGKKIVYIRLLDAAGNLVAANESNTFDYRGEKIAYSEKKEIDFKGAELMLCVDCKITQKLEKGTYKAELYNDGVLDGTSTFELN